MNDYGADNTCRLVAQELKNLVPEFFREVLPEAHQESFSLQPFGLLFLLPGSFTNCGRKRDKKADGIQNMSSAFHLFIYIRIISYPSC